MAEAMTHRLAGVRHAHRPRKSIASGNQLNPTPLLTDTRGRTTSGRTSGFPGFMITLDMLQAFFSDTRQKNTSTSQTWSIDEVCRWSYFFVDEDSEKLTPLVRHMQAQGYEFIGITEPDDADEDPFFYLQLDRIERHTPESLHARVQALYGIAEQFEIADYDGMNVGAA